MILLCPSLAILGNSTEFEKGVHWLSDNLTFDIDARVNLFEVKPSDFIPTFIYIFALWQKSSSVYGQIVEVCFKNLNVSPSSINEFTRT